MLTMTKESNAVLVLADRVRTADAVLMRHPAATVELLVFAAADVGSFIDLKDRYRDRVTISYISHTWSVCDADAVREIVGKKKKFAAILVDGAPSAIAGKVLAVLSKENMAAGGWAVASAAALSPIFLETTQVGPFTVARNRKPRVCLPKAWKAETASLEEPAYMRYTSRAIPEYVGGMTLEDVPELVAYNEDARDFPPRCHWGQKKLFMSEVQFLTRVAEQVGDLSSHVLVYVGAAHGHHHPLTYDLFPELDWIMYDPGDFYRGVYTHPRGKGAVRVFREFFTDDKLQEVKRMARGRRILFVCDIRLKPNEEMVNKDMIAQAHWGTQLGAEHMLLKFRLPYDNADSRRLALPCTFRDLRIAPEFVANAEQRTSSSNEVLYLDGTVNLQLYPPIHSTELRLHVTRQPDGRYRTRAYDYKKAENQMFTFNTMIRGAWAAPEEHPATALLRLIPGYDSSIECLMEYAILADYCRVRDKTTDPAHIIRRMFDLNARLEKNTGATQIDHLFRTMDEVLHKRLSPWHLKCAKLWQRIMLNNVRKSAAKQKALIEARGLEILGPERTAAAIKTLVPYFLPCAAAINID